MSDKYIGKDGLARNIARHKAEWKTYRAHMKAQPKSHDPLTNSLVEMCRATPWLGGHLWLYTGILAVIEAAAIAWLIHF